ncbi:MAG: hypothetical protein WCI51_07415 [Lentisphaerota bacterium]
MGESMNRVQCGVWKRNAVKYECVKQGELAGIAVRAEVRAAIVVLNPGNSGGAKGSAGR